MRSILHRAKAAVRDRYSSTNKTSSTSTSPTAEPPPLQRPLAPPTPLDVLRYRYHHGANLGSVFVLERWLAPDMFAGVADGRASELAAVSASVERIGVEETRRRWEGRWAEAVSDAQLEWLAGTACCELSGFVWDGRGMDWERWGFVLWD